MMRADAELARAVTRGGLEDARDSVVGPVVQLAHRVAVAEDGAAAAADLDTDALAEAALAGALALVAAPLLPERDVRELYAHMEPLIPRARTS